MKREKGFTVSELVICFILISIIVMGMFAVAINYKNSALLANNKLELERYKANLTDKIQSDIIDLGVKYINYCDSVDMNCVNIVFNDSSSKKLELSSSTDVLDRYIKYGGEKFSIEENFKGNDNPTLKDVSIILPNAGISLSIYLQNNSSLYSIDIPISHTALEGDYGLHIVALGEGTDPGVYKSTVTFDANGGTISNGVQSKQVQFASEYGELPTARNDGYQFLGWYTEKTGGTKVDSDTLVSVIRDHTLYARWDTSSYLVHLETNGGTLDNYYISVKYGDKYKDLKTPERKNYKFVGWYLSHEFNKEDKVDNNTVVTKKISHTLYARWESKVRKIIFATGYSDSDIIETRDYVYGEKFGELPIPDNPDGFSDFLGWNTSEDCVGTEITEDTIVPEAGYDRLFACWKS